YREAGPPVLVEVAELAEADAPTRVDVREELDDAWLALWADGRGFGDLGVARALLTGSPGRTAFARIEDLAIGRGVAVDGWLGITAMLTVPAARGRGHGRAILRALVAWARAAGCTRSLLQVDASALAARSLHESEGFRRTHEYQYVVAP